MSHDAHCYRTIGPALDTVMCGLASAWHWPLAGEQIMAADTAEHGIRLEMLKLQEARRVVLLILVAWKDKERFLKNANPYSIPGKSIH
jgi:hypothetical protein